jgi:hypothetical protein
MGRVTWSFTDRIGGPIMIFLPEPEAEKKAREQEAARNLGKALKDARRRS